MLHNKYLKLRLLRAVLGNQLVDKIVFSKNYYRFNKVWLWPDFKNGQRFNEKILYLKHHKSATINSDLVDKYKVRDYIASKIGADYLIPLYGVWSSSDSIDIAALPEKCVLKTNHVSGDVQLITDKSQIPAALKVLKSLLTKDYSTYSSERHYKGIKPVILAEALLGNGTPINDYKFFCFDGVPQFIQVDVDRFTNHTRTFFDPNWNNLRFSTLYPIFEGSIPAPENLQKMLEIASTLSQGFSFLRVDLYEVEGKVYFGELTFHHGNGVEPFKPDEYDTIMGNCLHLDRV